MSFVGVSFNNGIWAFLANYWLQFNFDTMFSVNCQFLIPQMINIFEGELFNGVDKYKLLKKMASRSAFNVMSQNGKHICLDVFILEFLIWKCTSNLYYLIIYNQIKIIANLISEWLKWLIWMIWMIFNEWLMISAMMIFRGSKY